MKGTLFEQSRKTNGKSDSARYIFSKNFALGEEQAKLIGFQDQRGKEKSYNLEYH